MDAVINQIIPDKIEGIPEAVTGEDPCSTNPRRGDMQRGEIAIEGFA